MNKFDIKEFLDMSKASQFDWLVMNTNFYIYVRNESLADLAFRLRDKAMSSIYLYTAMLDVHQAVEGPQERAQDYVFWAMRAKPIHWIAAALKAKENEQCWNSKNVPNVRIVNITGLNPVTKTASRFLCANIANQKSRILTKESGND